MNDGVVVLVSRPPDSDELGLSEEYRVAYVPDVDSLLVYNSKTGLEPNIELILDHFTEVTIWTNPDLAFEEADRILFTLLGRNIEPDNGVMLFSWIRDRVFTEL